MSRQPRVACCAIRFEIVVEWPDADVDAVFAEVGGTSPLAGERTHQVKTRTPTDASVERLLDAIGKDDYLTTQGLRVVETQSLMMGQCCVTLELPPPDETFTSNVLLERIEQAKIRIKQLVQEHVRYHAPRKHLRSGRVGIV